MRDKCLGQPFLQVLSRKLNSRKVFGRKMILSFIDASPNPRILGVLSDFHSTLISVRSLSSASGRISEISENIHYENHNPDKWHVPLVGSEVAWTWFFSKSWTENAGGAFVWWRIRVLHRRGRGGRHWGWGGTSSPWQWLLIFNFLRTRTTPSSPQTQSLTSLGQSGRTAPGGGSLMRQLRILCWQRVITIKMPILIFII